jgi:hypothetical protein
MAWRARAIRQNPEAFLERVREALRVIASEATAQFKAATALEPPRSQPSDQEVGAFGGSWHDPVAETALAAGEQDMIVPLGADPTSELVMPEWQNPMPLPASQRQPDDRGPEIDPRLLAGLSLPMLSGRLKRRSAEFKQLEKLVSDAERKAEDTRQRVRGLIDAEDADLLNGQ